jgi:hypothetical protein
MAAGASKSCQLELLNPLYSIAHRFSALSMSFRLLQIAYGGLAALTVAVVLKWASLEAKRFQ